PAWERTASDAPASDSPGPSDEVGHILSASTVKRRGSLARSAFPRRSVGTRMVAMSAAPPPANDDYAALAELAGGFIHEIKNHLNTLNLNLQLLGEDFKDPESQRERRALARVQKVQGECQRL